MIGQENYRKPPGDTGLGVGTGLGKYGLTYAVGKEAGDCDCGRELVFIILFVE